MTILSQADAAERAAKEAKSAKAASAFPFFSEKIQCQASGLSVHLPLAGSVFLDFFWGQLLNPTTVEWSTIAFAHPTLVAASRSSLVPSTTRRLSPALAIFGELHIRIIEVSY